MVQNALLGLQVVRLKSGDPLIFGRAGEEIEALRKADIEFEIVPGITAALGAAANAQIPLTHRQVSSAVVLVTGHQAGSEEFADWPAKIPTDATVVVYMPGYDYRSTAQQLLRAGLPGRHGLRHYFAGHLAQRSRSMSRRLKIFTNLRGCLRLRCWWSEKWCDWQSLQSCVEQFAWQGF